MIRSLIRNPRLTTILATLISLSIYCGQAQAASSMPTFAMTNVANGKMVDSQSLNGKVVLINFFTTW